VYKVNSVFQRGDIAYNPLLTQSALHLRGLYTKSLKDGIFKAANMFNAPETRANKSDLLIFITILIVAVILYLATNVSVFIAVLVFLHAGWKTFRTGLWLLKNDPCRARARICFTFYVAAAFWKAALAAIITLGVLIYASNKFGFQPNMDEAKASGITLFAGIILNNIIGLCATIAALHYKIRVWVHPQLFTMSYDKFTYLKRIAFPLAYINHAVYVVGTAIVFPFVIVGIVCLAILTCGNNIHHDPSNLEMIFELSILFGCPVAIIPCYAWISSRIIARNPQECWPIGTFGMSKE
jgi:hypothetical protein